MKKVIVGYLFLILIICSKDTNSQLNGVYNVGSNQNYTSLTQNGGIFSAINSQGLSGNVIINITSNIIEDGSNTLNQWTEYYGYGYTITIQPSNNTEKLIQGAPGTDLLCFNGSSRVVIDGSSGGNGRYLRFRNYQGNYPTFTFINGAKHLLITNCIIESNNLNTSSGTIFIGPTNGSSGNDSITISNCDIRDRSDSAGYPANAIFSGGSTINSSQFNYSNFILNNNIYNFSSGSDFSSGILLGSGTGANWIINGNSFYQTSSQILNVTYTIGTNVIWVNSNMINNCTITNNYIGGSSPNCGSSPWVCSNTNSYQFSAIRMYCGVSTASSVQGNTIANISISSAPTAMKLSTFTGILVQAGLVNIGNLTGNTIGNTTGTNSIIINNTGTGFYSSVSRGIDHRASGNVCNNNIGAISINGSNSFVVYLDGIYYSGTPGTNINISNNTVGSPNINNSIQTLSGNMNCTITGINSSVNNINANITDNTIANINNISSQPSSCIRGIIQMNYTTATVNISNNTIFNLTSASTSPYSDPLFCALIGIMTGATTSNQTLNNNVIYSLYAIGNANTGVTGIAAVTLSSEGQMNKNRIFDLRNSSNSGSPSIYGINSYWGNWTYINNQISITNGELLDNPIHIYSKYFKNTNKYNGVSPMHLNLKNPELNIPGSSSLLIEPDVNTNSQSQNSLIKHEIKKDVMTNGVIIEGIHDEAEVNGTYYYNSVYIGGSVSGGNSNSYCWIRPYSSYPTPITLRNNLFINARTGGSGIHYAIANEVNPPGTNWNSTASDYNLFITSDTNSVAEWGLGNNQSFVQWKNSVNGNDLQSWSTNLSSFSPSDLFVDLSHGNLNINSTGSASWYVNGKGIPISAVNSDFSGNQRSNSISQGATDIGSSEITPSSQPILAAQTGVLGNNQTTTYTFSGRILATIQWGSDGTVPSSVEISYFSGINPPNNAPSALFSNAYWHINAIGGSGYTYSITLSYDENILGTISNELSTRLAKSTDNGNTWLPFLIQGNGLGQTQLDTLNKTITVRGLTSFSLFTLTDDQFPLPVLLSSFSALVNNRDVNLNWATTHEINNHGFEIQRKSVNNNNLSDWNVVGFKDGKGTTNQPQSYNFTDTKLSTGKYQYRLKQIDYNGNSEFFALSTPPEVTIGKPGSFELFQNYPNPSNPATKIDYQIPFDGNVILKVYDIIGREIITLVNGSLKAGYYTTTFNGSNYASGVYIYRITALSNDGQKFEKNMKLVLVK